MLEALLKCLPVFAIDLAVAYPLYTMGQGAEAMRAIRDPGPVGTFNGAISFNLLTLYSVTVAYGFFFFLLAKWNYRADDGVRAFCRIWVPSMLALLLGLLWPILSELQAAETTLFELGNGLIQGSLVLGLLITAWVTTKPWERLKTLDPTNGLHRNQVIRMQAAYIAIIVLIVLLLLLYILGPPLWFYLGCYLGVTLLSLLCFDSFRDDVFPTKVAKNLA